ncbi:MAG TPA: dockerin type I domain-containing protein [Phycisphaerae bacterium]|nr:dockerin type I domain-containing protein [Phycisphaerae bacterium]
MPDQVSGQVLVRYTDVQDGWPGDGNIDADPLFIDPDGYDYHLSLESPCIDKGDPYFVPAPDERDIDGEIRVWDGDEDGDWVVDMGSDEFGSRLPGDIDGDGCVDQSDLGILLAAWLACQGDPDYLPEADLDGDGCINQSDLGILLAHWGEGCP